MKSSMPAIFHYQAFYTIQTSNRAYGGTINFKSRLIDATMQEFIHASQVWHSLVKENYRRKTSRSKYDRSKFANLLASLIKRMALYGSQQQYRQHQSMEKVQLILQTIYLAATYKTLKQKQAIQIVVYRLLPIVAILGTKEDKSLLYMIQQKLLDASVMILLVLLVTLKHNTIRKYKRKGIHVQMWKESSSNNSIANFLLVASLDQIVGKSSISFQNYLHKLDAVDQLNVIIIDKCHLFVTIVKYQKKMTMVKKL